IRFALESKPAKRAPASRKPGERLRARHAPARDRAKSGKHVGFMKIRITDIPPEGRTLSFELDAASINARANPERKASRESKVPEYVFVTAPRAELQLQLQGSAVSVIGKAGARFRTSCSRCAEDLENDLSI